MTARRRAPAVSMSERINALLDLDEVFELGKLIPEGAPCGRPRIFPSYMYDLYAGLISVFTSSSRVETELGSGDLWDRICAAVQARFPTEPSMWLPPHTPMRRCHYSYLRNRYLAEDKILQELSAAFSAASAGRAQQLGLCDPEGAGSLTHPSLERLLYADGKVVTPLYKAKPGTLHVDTATGEIREKRSDPDAHLHVTGSGEMAYGNKFVLMSIRLAAPHSRIVLGVASVPTVGGEVAVAMETLRYLAPLVPGAQGLLYDGAMHGVHMRVVLSDFGIIPVVPVTALSGGRRQRKPRVEKVVRVEAQVVSTPAGTETLQLYSCMGAIGLGELDECGEVVFRRLERVKVRRLANKGGTYRWYVEYLLPADKGGGVVRVRIDTTAEDDARRFNRSEHVRAIPTDDPDWARLYSRRSDAESINRALDDTLWLRRAHAKGRHRQLFELIGFALMTNAIAVARHGQSALSRAG